MSARFSVHYHNVAQPRELSSGRLLFLPFIVQSGLKPTHYEVEDAEESIHAAHPSPSAKSVVSEDNSRKEKEGECGVNPRPYQTVLALGAKPKVTRFVVHAVVLPSIRSES